LSLLFLSSCNNKEEKKNITAENGVIVINNFGNNKNYPLDGDWEFYWSQLLFPVNFENYNIDTVDFVKVNGVWNNYIVDDNKIGKNGFGTFHLKLVVPKGEYGLKIRRIETAYNLWIDDVLITSNGNVGKDKESSVAQLHPKIVFFDVKNDTTDVVIQVSNFHHRVGGIQNKIFIGKPKDIYWSQTVSLLTTFFLTGSFLIIAIYFLFTFIFTSHSGLAPLYFSLTIIFSILFALVNGESFFTKIFTEMPWEMVKKTDFIGNYGRLICFILFLKSIFMQHKILSNLLTTIITVIFSLFVLVVIVTPASFYTNTLYPFLALTFVILIFISVKLFILALKKDTPATIVLFGIITVVITFVNDALSYANLINTPYVANIGLFVFLLANSVVLALNISNARKTNVQYTALFENINKIRYELYNINSFDLGKMLSIVTVEVKSDFSSIFFIEDNKYKCEIIYNAGNTDSAFLGDALKIDFNETLFEYVNRKKKTIAVKDYILLPIYDEKKIKAVVFFKEVKARLKQSTEILEMLQNEFDTFISNYTYYYQLQNLNKNLEKIVEQRTNLIFKQKDELFIKQASLDEKLEELNISNSIIDDMNIELIKKASLIAQKIKESEEKQNKIKNQKEVIEYKNKTISSSINYSKTIQSTLLKYTQQIPKSEYFEISMPRNMVSGDFWFSQNYKNYTIIAFFDSTDTNVISTFLSIYIKSLFEEVFNKNPELVIKSPDLFLKDMKNIFFETIDKESPKDDDYDVFLCVINQENGKMVYAGEGIIANIAREKEILDLNLAKKVFVERKNVEYDSSVFELHYGDTLYVQSDGLINQIGQKTKKKFGQIALNNMLGEIQNYDFNKQKNEIINTFKTWKGDFKQVDDYLFVGFKFIES